MVARSTLVRMSAGRYCSVSTCHGQLEPASSRSQGRGRRVAGTIGRGGTRRPPSSVSTAASGWIAEHRARSRSRRCGPRRASGRAGARRWRRYRGSAREHPSREPRTAPRHGRRRPGGGTQPRSGRSRRTARRRRRRSAPPGGRSPPPPTPTWWGSRCSRRRARRRRRSAGRAAARSRTRAAR